MAKPPFIPRVSELVSKLLPQIQPACGPLFFTTSLAHAKGNVHGSGSFGLVWTGKKPLLVTCYHVWNDFLILRQKKADLKICTCLDQKNPIVLCTLKDGTKITPIDQSEELDIVTFDMSPFFTFCGEKHFFKTNCGDEPQLKEQDPVAIIGYPGKYRSESDEGISFGREPYCGFASSISGYKIVVDFTRVMSEGRELAFKVGGKHPFGGVSGGPCFLVKPNYEAILIGFVSQHISFSSTEANFLQMTSASCINDDGTLKPASYFRS